MIDLKNVILFCTALIIVAKILEVKCDLETEAPKHCGQYGFRCVEKHSFEICNAPDSDGYLDPDEVHNCAKDTACDEDNPAYCSPEDESFFKVGSCRSIRNANNMKLALHDDIDNEENEPDLTTIVSTTDKDELNNCEEEKYTEAPAFECEAQGFFAGMDKSQ